MKKKVLEITLKNREVIVYTSEQYDECKFSGDKVIVMKNGGWIAVYNFDCLLSVETAEVNEKGA